MGKTKPNQTKPKLNASASQLILNCRISEHNNKEINLIEHQYIVSQCGKTMQSWARRLPFHPNIKRFINAPS